MRKKEEKLVITFHTTAGAIAMEKLCGELGLPGKLVEKVPADGLCGSTDEQKLGFTYAVLDRYIREGVCEDESIRKRIDALHERNKFKLKPLPTFEP